MAATTKPSKEQQERTRAAIKTTQLVKRLQNYALGQLSDAGEVINIDASRLKAIEILLRKSLPDLSSVVLKGDEDSPLQFSMIELVAPELDENGKPKS
jgi:hypothetical protein